ncbi:MAG: hypothetical protein Q4A10_07250 [Aerococcaceae bacterium]|nr:hypothetical protein [Aerococcaceae bacterium]
MIEIFNELELEGLLKRSPYIMHEEIMRGEYRYGIEKDDLKYSLFCDVYEDICYQYIEYLNKDLISIALDCVQSVYTENREIKIETYSNEKSMFHVDKQLITYCQQGESTKLYYDKLDLLELFWDEGTIREDKVYYQRQIGDIKLRLAFSTTGELYLKYYNQEKLLLNGHLKGCAEIQRQDNELNIICANGISAKILFEKESIQSHLGNN